MKIKNQLIVSMVVFGVALIIITSSAITTNLQVAQLSDQQDIAERIQNGAGQLNHISTDYFLKQENIQLAQWQEQLGSISSDFRSLRPTSPDQREILNKIYDDVQQLNPAFSEVVTYLQNSPRNQSVRIQPQFQAVWGNLSEQNQALSIDSAQLSQALGNQADLLKFENSILIIALLSAFGAYFITIYIIMYRRGLRSVALIKTGTEIVGEGNLDYSIDTSEKNEFGDLSKAFNSMTRKLKTLTASKKQLETEVSERKRIEEQLEKSKSMLEQEKNILQAIMDEPKNMHLVYLDRDFNFLRVNVAYAKTCGFSTEEMVGKNHFALYPDEENEAIFRRVRETGEPASFHDKPFVFPDQPQRGVTYWDWTLSPVKGNSGNVAGLVFSLVETTERKRTEEQLLEVLEESTLRQEEVTALLAAAKSVLQNREFRSAAKVIFNSCKELLGATSGYVALLSDDGKDNIVLFLESGGLPCTVDPSLPMPIRGLREKAYNTGKVVFENNFPESEWTKLLPQGHVKLKNVLFSPLNVEGNTVGILGLANKPEKFTERDAQIGLAFGEIASIALVRSKMLEMLEENQAKLSIYSENLETLVEEKTKKLQDSERLAAIGATAAMVGHDIRNPLQAIASDIYLIRSDLASVPECDGKDGINESVESIDKNVDYVNKIVQDLQDFARPLRFNYKKVEINQVLKEALKGIRIPENIKVDVQAETDSGKFYADIEITKRILSNLVLNAIQAMTEGGKLTIGARQLPDYTSFFIQDTGVGIPEDVKGKIFTPLFTTKSKGQGFGLAVVKRMTEALGGTVDFETEVGKGTKFIVKLPNTK